MPVELFLGSEACTPVETPSNNQKNSIPLNGKETSRLNIDAQADSDSVLELVEMTACKSGTADGNKLTRVFFYWDTRAKAEVLRYAVPDDRLWQWHLKLWWQREGDKDKRYCGFEGTFYVSARIQRADADVPMVVVVAYAFRVWCRVLRYDSYSHEILAFLYESDRAKAITKSSLWFPVKSELPVNEIGGAKKNILITLPSTEMKLTRV
ncbi:hypothetical protein BDQ17DRAFT_1405418 [Cyathus striatus]|nr:hypothetical protein BDQ17DRAFT_1405418 [Cyathus striatus]